MADFTLAIPRILAAEGGFVDLAADRGGATHFGITLRTLSEWRGQPVTRDDVRALTEAEARSIYEARYWTPLRLQEARDQQVAEAIFDQAVNAGPGTAAKRAQSAINTLGAAAPLAVDGAFGPKSLEALNACDPAAFILAYFKLTQLAYVQIVRKDPTQLIFLEGWIRRTHSMLEPLIPGAEREAA
jgi:lysozyme family protein